MHPKKVFRGITGRCDGTLNPRQRNYGVGPCRYQEEELRNRAAEMDDLGERVAVAAQLRAEERKGRTEAERRLRAEKQVCRCYFMCHQVSEITRIATHEK